ncbi:MAG: SCO family protein [Hyphomicrobiales bacterium]|nr:SCO family protein [Hyphomicrobiales bacterium]
MTRIQIFILLALATVAASGLWAVGWLQPDQQTVRTTGTALVGGPFKLTGHDNTAVTDDQFRGKYMLVFFGYTYCPDVCPAGLQVMTAALEELGTKAELIQPLFITIDPERDTVPVMASYVENFHPRLIGLTGTPEQIADVAKAYRVYYKKAGDDADYLMDHSSILYLMDREGKFAKHFTYGTDAAALAKNIDTAISAN